MKKQKKERAWHLVILQLMSRMTKRVPDSIREHEELRMLGNIFFRSIRFTSQTEASEIVAGLRAIASTLDVTRIDPFCLRIELEQLANRLERIRAS